MMTYESQKTIKACRFCWMCRHLCPVGLATGKENNGPRAKAMFIELNEKRGGSLEADTALDMYECALCNACAANCETGYEPAKYIREARAMLAADGLVPEKVEKLISTVEESGNVYGTDLSAAAQSADDGRCDVLVYAGATALVKAPANLAALISVLKKAGIKARVFAENCSSAAVEYDLLGDVAEGRAVAQKCAEELNAAAENKLVVLDPSDAVMFKQQYPAWGIALKAEVLTATSYVWELIKEGKLNIVPTEGKVTYHDPCRLARDLDETEAARNIIGAMGYELSEMLQSRKLTRCCGGQVLSAHSPEITEKMVAARIEDAVRTGASFLVTACPGCSANLNAAEKMQVKDIFVLLDNCTK